VRGTVREATTQAPVSGAVVTLELDAAERAISVLSDAKGEFAIRALAAGRYRLSAKRIGVRRTVTEPFELGAGETKVIAIEIEPLLYVLPEVEVATANFCISRREQVGRIASLWEEIRTALTATSVSVRDSLYKGRVVSFGRLLDARGRVLSENTHQYDGLLKQTFAGVDPETLSVRGYWRDEGDSVRFDAPDVDVLLSPSFLNDHCFELASASQDEIGLRFQPGPGRPVSDVRGTIWVDSRTFELRRLEFGYTRLPRIQRPERFGGAVHFARLADGAWVVRRWSIRVPQFARLSSRGPGFTRSYDRPDPSPMRDIAVNRVIENRMIENGGIAYVDHLRSFEKSATVHGVVRDSAGRPALGARVRLAGTAYATLTDSSGRFRLDSVPPGVYQIEAVTEPTLSLGIADAETDVTVEPGKDVSVNLQFSRLDILLARMCGGRSVARDRTALRVVLTDSTAKQDPGITIRIWWAEYVRERGVNRVVQQQLDAVLGEDGSAIFCGIPVNVSIDLGLAIGPDRARRLGTVHFPTRVPQVRAIRGS
jgi:hypothetical protein